MRPGLFRRGASEQAQFGHGDRRSYVTRGSCGELPIIGCIAGWPADAAPQRVSGLTVLRAWWDTLLLFQNVLDDLRQPHTRSPDLHQRGLVRVT